MVIAAGVGGGAFSTVARDDRGGGGGRLAFLGLIVFIVLAFLDGWLWRPGTADEIVAEGLQ